MIIEMKIVEKEIIRFPHTYTNALIKGLVKKILRNSETQEEIKELLQSEIKNFSYTIETFCKEELKKEAKK